MVVPDTNIKSYLLFFYDCGFVASVELDPVLKRGRPGPGREPQMECPLGTELLPYNSENLLKTSLVSYN